MISSAILKIESNCLHGKMPIKRTFTLADISKRAISALRDFSRP